MALPGATVRVRGPSWNRPGTENRMFEKIRKFLGEIVAEMKKVTWPTREELKESTKLVIIATFVVTVFIGVVDQLLTLLIRRLLGW